MKKFVIQELSSGTEFDISHVCENPPFTQASFYGDWQVSSGRKVRRFVVRSDDAVVAYMQCVVYPLLFGKHYMYIPYGPIIAQQPDELLEFLAHELARIAQQERAVFVRLDTTPSLEKAVMKKYFTASPAYTYHSAYFQPRTEWMLSLQKTEEELFAAMDKKHRYSIKLSEQRDITTEIVTEEFGAHFVTFYKLMEETAKRNGFHLHNKAYYENVFQGLTKSNAYLVVARHQEKVLAVDVMIIYGGTAHYVFGCSSSDERQRMPAYAGLWRAIRHAREIGCKEFNFGGITGAADQHEGWTGLSLFKKRFGGRAFAHADFYDVVVSPLWYHLYNLRKRLTS